MCICRNVCAMALPQMMQMNGLHIVCPLVHISDLPSQKLAEKSVARLRVSNPGFSSSTLIDCSID